MLGPGSTVHWIASISIPSINPASQRWVFARDTGNCLPSSPKGSKLNLHICLVFGWNAYFIYGFTVQHFLQYLVGGDTRRELNMHYQVSQSSVFFFFFTTTRLVSSSNGDFLHGDQMGFLHYSRKTKPSLLKKTVDGACLAHMMCQVHPQYHIKPGIMALWSQSWWRGDKKMKNSKTSLDK